MKLLKILFAIIMACAIWTVLFKLVAYIGFGLFVLLALLVPIAFVAALIYIVIE